MIIVNVSGNLGQEASIRQAGNTQVVSFSVASTRKVKGEKETTWVRCSYFGAKAVAVAPFLQKGARVVVSGEGSLREYQGKTSLEVNVSNLELLGGAPRQQQSASESRPAQQHSTSRSDGTSGLGEDVFGSESDMEIPF